MFGDSSLATPAMRSMLYNRIVVLSAVIDGHRCSIVCLALDCNGQGERMHNCMQVIQLMQHPTMWETITESQMRDILLTGSHEMR